MEENKIDSAWHHIHLTVEFLQKSAPNYNDTLQAKIIIQYLLLANQLGYYKKIVDIAHKIKPEKYNLAIKNRINLYKLLGVACTETGDLETGLYYKQTALSMAITLFGEDQPELCVYYTHLGAHYRLMENFEQALLQYKKVETILSFHKKESSVEQIYNYVNIGNIYGSIEEHKKARNYYLKAVELLEKMQNTDIIILAKIYSNLSKVEYVLQFKDEAKQHASKSLQLLYNNLGKTHPHYFRQLLNYADMLQQEAEYDSSLTMAYQSLYGFKKLYGDHHPDVAHAHIIITNHYILNKKWDSALTHIDLSQKACIINHKLQKTEIFAQALLLKALVFHEKKENVKKILNCYTSYDSIIQYKKNILYNPNDKIELIRESKLGYEQAIKFCYSSKLYEQAFYFSEQSKSAVLLASILESNARQLSGLPDSVTEKESFLKTQLAEAEIKILQMNENTPQDQKLLYEKQYYEYASQLETYLKKIEQQFPDYYHLKYKPSDISLSDIQKKLPQKAMIVSYVKTEQNIYLLCITKKKIFMEEKPIPENFKGYITALRRAIKNKLPDYAWKPDAAYLGKILLPSEIPATVSSIIVVPEDVLLKIPFECLGLPTEKQKIFFCAEKYSISYSYSCKLWYELQQRSYSVPYSVTAIAPVFNTKESIRLSNGMLVEGLPATIQETNYISEIFLIHGMSAQVFLNQDAQESIVKEKLSQSRFIHFATHGYFDATNPGLSCIMMHPPLNDDEDGILYTKEIYNLSVKAELVILSACETGLGNIFRGEGTIGLTRAWLYAGTKYVMASLWRVNDIATAKLMSLFYFYLIEKKQSIETALHKAKLNILKDTKFQHPYYWSSFILIH